MSEYEGFDQDTAPQPMPTAPPGVVQQVPVQPQPHFQQGGIIGQPGAGAPVDMGGRTGLLNEHQAQVTGIPTEPIQDAEISFEHGDNEENLGGEQPPAPQAVHEEPDVRRAILPRNDVKVWTFGGEAAGLERQYIQRPLSFAAKIEWFGEVGKVIDRAMSGEGALTMKGLFSAPTTRGNGLSMTDLMDADTFVQALGKLISYSPKFMTDSFAIWLAVPDYERDLFKELMNLPVEEGGLSDDDGFEIIERFIDQNYASLEKFFRERLGQLRDRIEAQRNHAEPPSTPSRSTRPTTPNR
jgi:hypothetical protein